MSDFYIGQGDTASPIVRTLTDALGAAVDIQGATVRFNMIPIRGGTPVVNAGLALNQQNGTGVDGTKGRVAYGTGSSPWGGATAVAGDYLVQFVVTFADGTVETFPNGGYLLLTVTADPATSATLYVSADELKKTMSMLQTTFADADFRNAAAAATQAIDNYCGRTFKPHVGADTQRIYTARSDEFVPIHDLQDVPSLLSINGDTTAVLATDYWLEAVPAAYPGPPYAALRKITRTFSRGVPQAVKVTGKWGWPAVPAPITSAASIIASRLLRRQREAPFGILPFGDQGEAMRLTQADPDVKFLLTPYRRVDLYL